jgi:hypothetical protein
MNYLGLSEKEYKAIANAVAPDGWVIQGIYENGKPKVVASPDQIEAVRRHLSTVLMMDKKKEYLLALVERLRPEVEAKVGSPKQD